MGPFPHRTVTWNDLLYKYNAHFGTTLSVINWQHIQMMAPYNNALKKTKYYAGKQHGEA